MLIPSFIPSKPIDSDGNWTPEWAQLLQQLFTTLQKNIGQEGFIIPSLTAAQISSMDASKNVQALIYKSDSPGSLVVNLNGTFKTVQTV